MSDDTDMRNSMADEQEATITRLTSELDEARKALDEFHASMPGQFWRRALAAESSLAAMTTDRDGWRLQYNAALAKQAAAHPASPHTEEKP